MARRRVRDLDQQAPAVRSAKPTPLPTQVIPTGDVRHASWIRQGRQSAEVFDKKHFISDDPYRSDNASTVVPKRRKKSTRRNAKAVRNEAGNVDLLRTSEQAGQGEVEVGQGQEYVSETKKRKKEVG